MTVVWSPHAIRDLDGILAYIHDRSHQGADSISRAIERSVAICARHPALGIPTDEPGILRWPVGAYL